MDTNISEEKTVVNTRVKEIDIMRGLAIFLVVLGHAIIVYPINLHEITWCKTLHDLIYSFHMELFFVISGWCFKYNGKIQVYIKKKLKRLIIPYLFFSAIDYAVRIVFSTYVNRTEMSWKYILLYGGNYWFIYTLVLISFVYIAVSKIPNSWLQTILVILLFYISGFAPEVLCLKFVCKYLLYFHIGKMLKDTHAFDKIAKRTNAEKGMALLICSVGWCALFFLPIQFAIVKSFAVAMLGVFTMILLIYTYPSNLLLSHMEKFGSMTLQLYLVEGFFLVIARTIICKIINVSNPGIIITGLLMVDFFVAYYFVSKMCKMSRIARFIFGVV